MAKKDGIDLSEYHCKGCGHHCPLSHPRCKKGRHAREALLNKTAAEPHVHEKKHNKKKQNEKKLKKARELDRRLSRLSEDEQKLLKQLLDKMLQEEEEGK